MSTDDWVTDEARLLAGITEMLGPLVHAAERIADALDLSNARVAAQLETAERFQREMDLARQVSEAVPPPSPQEQLMEAAREMAKVPGPFGEMARQLFGLGEDGNPERF